MSGDLPTRGGAPFWLSVDTLFRFEHMPDWRALNTGGFLVSREPKVAFFISHPWESIEHPDPSGEQWRTLRILFRHVLGAHGPQPLQDGGLSSASSLFPHSFEAYTVHSDALLGRSEASSTGRRAVNRRAVRILGSVNQTIEALAQGETVRERHMAALRRRVGLWIDYCCLPQGVRSAEEQLYFEQALPQLTYLAARSTVLALWPREVEQRTRAWCLVEAAINTVASDASLVRIDGAGLLNLNVPLHRSPPGRYAPALVDVGPDTADSLSALVSFARGCEGPADVLRYFERTGLRSTYARDLHMLSAALFAAVAPARRIGVRAVVATTAHRCCVTIWWLLAGPAAALYPLATLAGVVTDRFVHAEPTRLAERALIQTLMFLGMLIYLALMVVPFLVLLVLTPINAGCRRLEDWILRSRGRYVARVASGARLSADRR